VRCFLLIHRHVEHHPRDYAATPSRKVAFLGLGVMGYPMAGHLAKAGHQVTVYNRSAAKRQAWVAEFGGAEAATPRAAAQGADIVFCCVGNDDDLRSVVLGADGALAGMQAGAILSTTPPLRPKWPASCMPRHRPRGSISSTPRSPAVRPVPRMVR
jgi:glycine/D-amino acid oxidase-like deaminating enzyme